MGQGREHRGRRSRGWKGEGVPCGAWKLLVPDGGLRSIFRHRCKCSPLTLRTPPPPIRRLVLTNSHVVSNATAVYLRRPGVAKKFKAEVLAEAKV